MKTLWSNQAEPVEILQDLAEEVTNCGLCPLAVERLNTVFGEGNLSAKLMFVGEGPGADEDARGQPFVGRAGEILNNMIASMGLARKDVYIANVVKCRPPGNRAPTIEEAGTCYRYLYQQIRAVRPRVIVALGNVPTQFLLQAEMGITQLRGQVWPLEFVRGKITYVIPTFHPGYLLRTEDDADYIAVDADLKKALEYLQK